MEDLYQTFERYLNEELEGESLEAFEKLLSNDADIHSQFEVYKALQEDLSEQFEKEEATANAENTIKAIHKSHFEQEEQGAKIRHLSFGRWAAAASVLLLVLAVWFMFPSKDGDVLAEFSNYPNLSLTTRGDAPKDLEQRSEQYFNDKNYKAALVDLTALYARDSLPKVLLFKGIAAMESGDYEEAKNAFVGLNTNAAFEEDIAWYQALNLLKQEKKEEGLAALKAISSESDYYEKAQKIIKALY